MLCSCEAGTTAHCHACARATWFRLTGSTLAKMKHVHGQAYLANTPACYMDLLEAELAITSRHPGLKPEPPARSKPGDSAVEEVDGDEQDDENKRISQRKRRKNAVAQSRERVPSPVEWRILFPCAVCGELTFDGETKRAGRNDDGRPRWATTPFPGQVGLLVCGRCWGCTDKGAEGNEMVDRQGVEA